MLQSSTVVAHKMLKHSVSTGSYWHHPETRSINQADTKRRECFELAVTGDFAIIIRLTKENGDRKWELALSFLWLSDKMS